MKETLLLKEFDNAEDKKMVLLEIDKKLQIWTVSHLDLHLGDTSFKLPYEDDPKVRFLFKKLEPHHSAMVNTVENVLATHQKIVPHLFNKRI